MKIIGIDPGIEGAIALIRSGGIVETFDIARSMDDAITVLRDLAGSVDGCVIEKVGAMPKQGVSSTFNFGVTYGHLRGAVIALGIPLIAEPTPVVWKRLIFGATIKGVDRGDQKRMARDKARELYPGAVDLLRRVKDADRAEAILLAHYGLLIRAQR